MSALAASSYDAGSRSSPSACGIVVGRNAGRVVVSIYGELDDRVAVILERVLTDLIDGQGNLDVVVDLTGARACDALPLAAFRTAAELSRRHRGQFKVHAAPGPRADGGRPVRVVHSVGNGG